MAPAMMPGLLQQLSALLPHSGRVLNNTAIRLEHLDSTVVVAPNVVWATKSALVTTPRSPTLQRLIARDAWYDISRTVSLKYVMNERPP